MNSADNNAEKEKFISKEKFIQECDKIIPSIEFDKFKQCKKKRLFWLIGIAIVFILLFGISFLVWAGLFLIGFLLAIVAVFIVIFKTRYKWNQFSKNYSKDVLNVLLKDYRFSYNPDKGIPWNKVEESRMAGSFNLYSGEDLLMVDIPKDNGEPSGVRLFVSDVHTRSQTERTVTYRDEKGNLQTRTETIIVTTYKGAMGYVKFPFKFKCDLSLNKQHLGLKKIELEDVVFNKEFKTYTDNQLEALLILTPSLIKKLVSLASRLNGLKFYLTKQGQLFFGMDLNLFRIKKRKPTGAAFENYYYDIRDILAIINEIKDNNKVFKM